MATFSALPEVLDISFVGGDEFVMPLDFDVNLTGYTLEAKVIKIIYQYPTPAGSVVTVYYEDLLSFTIVQTNLSSGQIALTLSESQTISLLPSVGYDEEAQAPTVNAPKMRWYLRWVTPAGVTQTVRAGSVDVRTP